MGGHAVNTDLIWINGEIMPLEDARVSVEDRGFQFADGVYEVVRFYRGRCFTLSEHLDRLEKSAQALRIKLPIARSALANQMQGLVTRSGLADGMIYLQLTRGVAPRAHPFPVDASPTLLFHTRELPPVPAPENVTGIRLITLPDERWHKCWVKSTGLQLNVLAKQQAIEAGADEAAFVYNGVVTECCATNIFFVIGGQIVTHPVGEKVLPGITRLVIQQLAEQIGVTFVERGVSLEAAKAADEIFITSTTRELHWVLQWDGAAVGPGRAGKITRMLHDAYQQRVRAEC